MPILKKSKVGKHDNVTVIEFGHGDVLVSNGHCGYDKSKSVVTFGQGTPKPVNEYSVHIPITEKNTDGLENPVIFRFSRPESIDIIIENLQKAKEYLLSPMEGIRP